MANEDPTTTDLNPRATMGGNNPPVWAMLKTIAGLENFSATVTEYLADEYKQWPPVVAELLEEARALPKEITDPETKAKAASIIRRMRDTAAKLDKFHTGEKEPYLRGGQGVDQFFFGFIDKLARRSKSNNPGGADVLNQRITDYDNRVLAAEQERRRLAAEEEARKAEAARREREEQDRIAEEARLAAERARKPETREEKSAIAQQAEQVASNAAVEATVQTAKAEAAYIATLATPAAIMRTRTEDGVLSTMQQETYATLVDRSKLNKEALWPFIPLKALEQALGAWAKTTDYRVAMEGAEVGRRNKSLIR